MKTERKFGEVFSADSSALFPQPPYIISPIDLKKDTKDSTLLRDDESLYQTTDKLIETKDKFKALKSETIREWWKGEVMDINVKENYFEAKLRDLSGRTCVAEFDIDKVFDDPEDVRLNLFPHAEFAFFVTTNHGPGRPTTSYGIEFSAPYIWQEKDNEAVAELMKFYFIDER